MKSIYLFLALTIPLLSFGQSTPCSIDNFGNNFENAEFGLHAKYIANDFDVEESIIMEINKITPTIVRNIGVADVFIYNDDDGQPGTLITSFVDIIPTSQTLVSNNFGLPWYEVELDLPSTVSLVGLTGGSKYWIGLFVTAGSDGGSGNFWEVKTNGDSALTHTSLDQGATWTPSPSGNDGVFQVFGSCSIVVPLPDGYCEIVEAGNNFENAEMGLDAKFIANDFDIEEDVIMQLDKILPTIVNNIDTADIFIYEDDNGKPGTLITSFQNITPTSQTQVSSNFGLPWYEVELNLPNPVSLEGLSGGSKYWVGLFVTMGSDAGSANFWEVKSNATTAVTHTSLDQGDTWTPNPSSYDGVFQVSGICSIVEPEPIGFCEIIEEGNNFENAEIGLNSKYIANDFDIEEGTIMELNKIIPTIVNNIGVADIFIYEDNNGQPGTLITSFQDVVPTSQTQVSSNFSLPWYEVELELPSSVSLEGLPGGSKYWIGLFVTAGSDGASNNFWEVKSNGTTAYIHTSVDQGATWIASTSNYDGVFQVSGICSTVEPEPIGACEIIELGNGFENAEFGLNLKYIANDFDIAEGVTMEINKILPTLINNIEVADIFIYEDNNGQPGTLITSFQNVTPTSQTQVSNNFNLPWYEVALDLPNSVLLEGLAGGSKYWIGLKTTLGPGGGSANFWEVKSNGDTAFTHTSLDQGATWTPSTSGFDGVFQVFGVCSEEEPEPIGACEIIEAGNNFENAEVGLNTKYIANDFDIEEGVTMEINKITPTIINNIEVADIFIYEDNDGQPGNLITSFQDVVPTSQTQVSSNFSLPWYEVELELPSSVSLAGLSGGSKYWIGLFVTMGSDAASANFWEVKSNGSSAYTHSSLDQGTTWTPSPSGFDGVFNISGTCSEENLEPMHPCGIVEAGNNFENAEFGLHTKFIANDFDVEEDSSMELVKIIPTLVRNIGVADIFIYEDNNGSPGNLITSFQDVTPTSQTLVSNNFNLPWYEVELELPNTVTLEGHAGGTKYWIGLFVTTGPDGGNGNFWEVKTNGTTAVTHSSIDQGATWTPSASGFDGVFKVIGNCSGEIVIDGFTYENGSWTPSDPSGIATATDDIVIIDGTTSLSTDTAVNNLIVMSGATLNIEGVLSLSGNMMVDGNLVFVSTPTSNGELAEVPNTSLINGEVTVQRYMQNSRSYRMVSSAVTTTTSIHENWQEGATSNTDNPAPGFGTHITGTTADQTNGFDGTITGNSSMFTVNVPNQQFEAINNTDINTLNAGEAYLLFVRGDRSIDLTNPTDNLSSSTVLRTTGSLITGTNTQNFATSTEGDLVMFGNPYQSTVDINSVFAASTNVNTGYYYVYDPSLGAYGSYVTVILPSGSNTSGSTANQFLQPGQGAQVSTLAAGTSSIVLSESDKSPGEFTNSNRPFTSSDMLTVKLFTTENFNNRGSVHDSFGIVFAEGYNNGLTSDDAVKPMNFYENLGINNNGTYLSIEQRELPQSAEVYTLYSTGYTKSEYTLKLTVDGLENTSLYLDDRFTGLSTLLATGDTTYGFTVDANNPISIASDRFSIRTEQRLGVEDNDLLAGIRLFPNPFNGNTFYINAPKLNGEQLTVSINDLTGRNIYEKTLDCLENTITVKMGDNISSGVYLVTLNYDEEANTYRLINE